MDPNQGFVAAEIQVEDGCYVWTIDVTLRMNLQKRYEPEIRDGVSDFKVHHVSNQRIIKGWRIVDLECRGPVPAECKIDEGCGP